LIQFRVDLVAGGVVVLESALTEAQQRLLIEQPRAGLNVRLELALGSI
jgi:hypothetical protein